MSTEEKFKDLLRDKLENKEFPFNPANWEKAETLIDATRARKRRLIPFIFLCVGIFISGGLSVYLYTHFTQKTTSPVAQQHETVVTEVAATSEKQQSSAPENNNNNNSYNNNPINTDNDAPAGQSSNRALPDGRNVLQDKNVETPVTTTQPVKSNPTSETGTRSRAETIVKPAKVKETPIAPIVNKGSAVASLTKRKNKKAESSAGLTNDITMTQDKPAQNASDRDTRPALNGDEAQKSPTAIDETKSAENKNPAQEISPANQVVSQPENQQPVTETKALPTPIVQSSPDVVASVQQPAAADSSEQKFKEDPKNFFSVEAGAYYHLPWTKAGNEAHGINPVIGANYQRLLTDKMSVALGIHYTTVGYLHNYSHTSKDTRYGLGEYSNVKVITPVKIHYLQFPLKFNYNLNEKNMVGVGYTFGYMLTVNNKVENYSQLLTTTTDTKVTKTRGYSEGFNPYDSQVSVFYRRSINNYLSFNTELLFGLADVKDNTFFVSKSVERNSGVKLTLIYNLFKK